MNRMILRLLVCLILGTFTLQSNAQRHFGIYFQTTHSTQLVQSIQEPDLGTFVYNYKSGIGGGLVYEIDLARKVSLSNRINYSQKGFAKKEFPYEKRPNKHEIVGHTTHFMRLDQLIKLRFDRDRMNCGYALGGIRNEYLMSHDLPAETPHPQLNDENILVEDYERWNFGTVLGAGLKNCNTFIEAGMDMDLAPSHLTENTSIKNLTWFANIGILI